MEQIKIIDFAEQATPESPRQDNCIDIVNEEGVKETIEMNCGTDLALIAGNQSIVTIESFSKENGLDGVINKIKEQVQSEVFDVTTKKGRERIGSVARQIGSAKERLKEKAEEIIAEDLARINKVKSEAKRMGIALDKLRDEVLKPRDEYNQIERDRVKAHAEALEKLNILQRRVNPSYTVDEIERAINQNSDLIASRDWQEFKDRAQWLFNRNVQELSKALNDRKKFDDDQAELSRLREEEEKRKKKEEEDRIAKEAADKARQEAEAEAEKKRKEMQEEQDRIQREKEQAEARANKLEEDRKASINAAITSLQSCADVPDSYRSTQIRVRMTTLEDLYGRTNWQEFADQALKSRDDVKAVLDGRLAAAIEKEQKEAKAEEERQQAEQKRRDEETAQRERDRIAAEEKAKADAEAVRAANIEHQRKINNEAKAAMHKVVEAGINGEDPMQDLLVAIIKGQIPHVSIRY